MLVGMILGHLRQNLVAYLALVVALSTGSAYAAAAIANGSVTTKKLANNAVTSTKLKNNSVKSIDIKSGTVNSDDIGTNAVSSLEIGDSSVTTVDIQDGTVISADIKDDSHRAPGHQRRGGAPGRRHLRRQPRCREPAGGGEPARAVAAA